MRHHPHLAALAAVVLGLALAAGTAPAQAPVIPRPIPGYGSPTVSPYINLLRNVNPQVVNYYGLVRPQVQFQGAVQGLQEQVTTLDATTAQAAAGLPPTGHTVSFRNYRGYFGRMTAVGVGGPVTGLGTPAGGGMAAAGRLATPTGGAPAAPRR